MRAHLQGSVVYKGSSWPDLRTSDRTVIGRLPSFTTADLTAGFTHTSWRAELYVKNVFDENGQLDRSVACASAVCSRVYITPIRPRTIGLRFGQSF
jgi:outer membrane receptor protein involved in Fe transport